MDGFVLTSSSFEDGGPIPSKHTCDGQDVSPPLAWAGAPEETRSFALVVDDPDARGFIHWIAYNMPGGTSGGLREGIHPDADPLQGRNDFGRTGWGGPCPPSGVHHYRFTLYALSSDLAFGVTATAPDLQRAIEGKLLAQTTLTGTYIRGR
jgi:Raf kinase inhibitor-like YbhB/YbcL family protein